MFAETVVRVHLTQRWLPFNNDHEHEPPQVDDGPVQRDRSSIQKTTSDPNSSPLTLKMCIDASQQHKLRGTSRSMLKTRCVAENSFPSEDKAKRQVLSDIKEDVRRRVPTRMSRVSGRDQC